MYDQTTNPDPDRLGEANRLTETRQEQPTVHRLGATNQEAGRGDQIYTVQETAETLDITVDAVRGRIRRGTLASKKVDGQVYVLLGAVSREQHADQSTDEHVGSRRLTDDKARLVDSLQERISASEDQIEWLRREVERKDTIIMQMAQRIPELEAAPETRGAPDTAAGGTDRGNASSAPEQRRSWLYRFFFSS
jgi:hypothetical protein